ncbi:lipid-transfer protein [Denitratisoma oestradiolicum]|uniref:Lipid-transfer protein n=1 Tax=Denitratisoma oestradiolicum TaxID=311182 RepID=A0A6S6XVV1_9PROT|nr:lipid-transfer protein [Denitratisoma oestradiolicum]TWO78840.1 lipid-transfer protein [Denitratisoma oestradiolicum]CAB1368343.1 Lipid-transfer protein [Denitratisoma oestradiolicum]
MNSSLSRSVSISGVGTSDFSKNSGRTEIHLAMQAILCALDDAGIDPSEVDGLSTYTMDNVPEREVFRLLGGKRLKFFSRTYEGGGAACAPILHGAMAIYSGVCDVVVGYRAMNERSWYRFGAGVHRDVSENPLFETTNFGWYIPHGLVSPASWVAMAARRYMHDFGATSEDFGRVAVGAREFAATNPAAFFYQKPLSLDEHQQSRWVAEPLHLYDCCQESDGAVAIVMVSAERAKTLKSKPVMIAAAAQGMCDDQQLMTSFYRQDISALSEMKLVAEQLYAMADLSPSDIQTAILYDHFSPFVLPQLEVFGFCDRGQAKDFVRAGEHLRCGVLPVNPHGGQLGEAYIHGFNGVAEGVRQVRGTSVNQVANVRNVLVSAGTGVPTSGVILSTV